MGIFKNIGTITIKDFPLDVKNDVHDVYIDKTLRTGFDARTFDRHKISDEDLLIGVNINYEDKIRLEPNIIYKFTKEQLALFNSEKFKNTDAIRFIDDLRPIVSKLPGAYIRINPSAGDFLSKGNDICRSCCFYKTELCSWMLCDNGNYPFELL